MSTRSIFRPESVITNGDMTTTLTSKPTVLQSLTLGSYAYSWAGTSPVGSLAIQLSNDYALTATGQVANAGTWNTVYVTLNGATTVNSIPVSGNTGNGIAEWSTGAYAIRTIYTPASGSGSLQAIVDAKVS